jgi:hypothetical protein
MPHQLLRVVLTNTTGRFRWEKYFLLGRTLIPRTLAHTAVRYSRVDVLVPLNYIQKFTQRQTRSFPLIQKFPSIEETSDSTELKIENYVKRKWLKHEHF